MAAHRYWRIYSYKTDYEPWCAISEIELRTTEGGADQTGGGTASADSNFDANNNAPKAVDNNAATTWITASATSPPHWWAYDFGEGQEKDIVEIAITPRGGGLYLQTPQRFDLQYSDNGSDWTLLYAFFHDWQDGNQVVFNSDDAADTGTGHRYWRLYVTETGVANWCAIGELELRTAEEGEDHSHLGLASASTTYSFYTYYPELAIDNNTGNAWVSTQAAGPWWWKLDFGPLLREVVEINITPRGGGLYNQTPAVFDLQYSDNGSDWTTLFSVDTVWENGTARTFSGPPESPSGGGLFFGHG